MGMTPFRCSLRYVERQTDVMIQCCGATENEAALLCQSNMTSLKCQFGDMRVAGFF